MILVLIVFGFASLVDLPQLNLTSSHVATDPNYVEYQRSYSYTSPDVNPFLTHCPDHYKQGECLGLLRNIQGKDHVALHSGWGLPRGKTKHLSVANGTIKGHGLFRIDKDVVKVDERIGRLNKELFVFGSIDIEILLHVLVNDSYVILCDEYYYVDDPLTLVQTTTKAYVDATVLCNVSQAEVDPSGCPRMRSFASIELQIICDTFKLPFKNSEILYVLHRSIFNETYLFYCNYNLNVLCILNLSKAWDVDGAPEWSYTSRPQHAVLSNYISNVSYVGKILMSPISQRGILALNHNYTNVLSYYMNVPETNLNQAISNKYFYRSVTFSFSELNMIVLTINPCCCQCPLPMDSTTGSTLLCTLPCRTWWAALGLFDCWNTLNTHPFVASGCGNS